MVFCPAVPAVGDEAAGDGDAVAPAGVAVVVAGPAMPVPPAACASATPVASRKTNAMLTRLRLMKGTSLKLRSSRCGRCVSD